MMKLFPRRWLAVMMGIAFVMISLYSADAATNFNATSTKPPPIVEKELDVDENFDIE